MAALDDIAISIEHALTGEKRCIIPFAVYSAWQPEILSALVSAGIIKKERSGTLENILCFCGSGEALPVQYHPDTNHPFVQCFSCYDVRQLSPEELIYYYSSSRQIASFFVNALDDNDQSVSLVRDKVFFAGETVGGILIFVACGLQNNSSAALLAACEKHAQTQSFLVLTSHIPANIPKKYTLVSIADKKLYCAVDDSIRLDIAALDKTFAKHNINQAAADAKWAPKKNAEKNLTEYLALHIQKWPMMNHAQIAEHIHSKKPRCVMYKDASEQERILSATEIKTVVRKFFTSRGEQFRIIGNPSYNSDPYTWHN